MKNFIFLHDYTSVFVHTYERYLNRGYFFCTTNLDTWLLMNGARKCCYSGANAVNNALIKFYSLCHFVLKCCCQRYLARTPYVSEIYSHFVYSHFVYWIFRTVSSTTILSTFSFQYIKHIVVRIEKRNDEKIHTTYQNLSTC